MMPVNERSSLIQPVLPEDPTPGQVFKLPKKQVIGGANVINVYKAGNLIGSTTNLVPVANVTGKYYVERLSSVIDLDKGDVIRIVAQQLNFNEITFVEFFGWIGTGVTDTPILLSDKHYRVLAAIPIGPKTHAFRLYEKVCIEVIQGAKR